ncbi:MAG TPA: hypothetical protein PLV73_09165 [Treponemataceae bacterium]|jgi:hypothetical protein|nr:hypothetical protein [Treponema sp.]OQB04940.1 MAG: hypothetical protein BWY20_00271 [Spirochaetes bacterium ADurb.Bin215]HOF86295.1 hypothetical protein [Treponemataceae bacterium]HOS35415.1 hypothetical protein [Treponemataceae bacterium]HPA10978.1 hypothetical protein [Treponemataceae bacterium]
MFRSGASGCRIVRLSIAILFLALTALPVFSYVVQFKEQFYRLYHIHYHQYPDDTMENIYWLERAVEADFANPLYALGKITDEEDWEKYRYLFMMHLNLKLVEQHLRLGSKWDKQVAYFYNAPWKEQNIESLQTAETCYNAALHYWNEAKLWAEKANMRKFRFLFLTDLQYWEDERERIATGSLDYERTIGRELARLEKVRANFLAMDENTY